LFGTQSKDDGAGTELSTENILKSKDGPIVRIIPKHVPIVLILNKVVSVSSVHSGRHCVVHARRDRESLDVSVLMV